jgi:antitoxin MazE
MRARIIRIGNALGIRLPKSLLKKAGLTGEVEIVVRNGAIVISSAARPRAGWYEAAKFAHERGDDVLLDPPTSTRFDNEAWKW